MVVLAGGGLAMGRYEVTVGEYRAFASATGAGASASGCSGREAGSWNDPGFAQTDRHPVTCVGWDGAQEYVSWLSRTTGAPYRLPTEVEWERAAAGTPAGVGCGGRFPGGGTCPVGSYGANAAGLSDMVGNVAELTSDCFESSCMRRAVRGGAWVNFAPNNGRFTDDNLRVGSRFGHFPDSGTYAAGFRVARTLD